MQLINTLASLNVHIIGTLFLDEIGEMCAGPAIEIIKSLADK